MIVHQFVVLISFLSSGVCLECYLCYNAKDPSLCRHHVTCISGQSCGKEVFHDSYGTVFDLGCVATSNCPKEAEVGRPSSLFGRRRGVSEIDCCHTDFCNINMTTSGQKLSTTTAVTNVATSMPLSTLTQLHSSPATDACADHPDCDILIQGFNACNDSDIALGVCRKSCGLCDVTTPTPLCMDAHQDCQILATHLHVCEDDNFARTRCRRTCGVCVSDISFTVTSVSTPLSTLKVSGVCEDRRDCVLLEKINICDSSITAQICPVFCGLCQINTDGITRFSTTQSTTDHITEMINSAVPSTKQTIEIINSTVPSTDHTIEIINSTVPPTRGLSTTQGTTEATKSLETTETHTCRDILPREDCQQILRDDTKACSKSIMQMECKQFCMLCGPSTTQRLTDLTTETTTSLETSESEQGHASHKPKTTTATETPSQHVSFYNPTIHTTHKQVTTKRPENHIGVVVVG
ncbi:uncharacterized protein LOC125665877 isoform X2 [Ostrea edulis]|uniref:uncharacterized protein LOC125665877 isoform X2 n=1 Tax=Ostrea edulis TaxID=37623 RepID=UPI0024AF738C|nr:uncharacterized protein LOC125665877 isoform X2 [Ostrea edulis]